MKLRENSSYSIPQRLLHWAVTVLVFFNLLLPDGMNRWVRAMENDGSATPQQISSANLHAYVGIAILLCATLRLVFRYVQGVPPESETEPRLFRALARIAHACLYLLLLAMPISGMAAYYFGLDLAGSLHGGLLKGALWVLIAGHIAGVLMHQFYWRTNILRRMTMG